MKRINLLLLVCFSLILFVPRASAGVLPDDSIWSLSKKDFLSTYSALQLDTVSLGLHASGLRVGDYRMDGFFEFEDSHLKLIVYVLPPEKYTANSFKDICKMIQKEAGKPKKKDSGKQTWELTNLRVQVIQGGMSRYTGSSKTTVGIGFAPRNVSAPAASKSTNASSSKSNLVQAQTAAAKRTSRRMRVSINAYCYDNDSVGSDWYEEFTVNGRSIWNGGEVEVKPNQSIKVGAVVTEDDSRPDVGRGSYTYKVDDAGFQNGFDLYLEIQVRENNGKYKGNSAWWRVNYSFRPID